MRFLRVLVAASLVTGAVVEADTAAGATPVWSVVPSASPLGPPTGGTTAVACPTTTTCFAVGSYETSATNKSLVER